MARARVRVPNSLKVKTARQLDKLVKNPTLLKDVKDFTVQRIVSLARLQKSMEGASRGRSLPKLSKSYIAARKGEVHFRTINGKTIALKGPDPDLKTDPEFFQKNATKSNWTLTGQFLKSIKGRTARSKIFRGSVIIAPTGRRKDGNKNVQIHRWLTQLNKKYEIFSVNKQAQKQIAKITTRFLRKKLRNKIRLK